MRKMSMLMHFSRRKTIRRRATARMTVWMAAVLLAGAACIPVLHGADFSDDFSRHTADAAPDAPWNVLSAGEQIGSVLVGSEVAGRF